MMDNLRMVNEKSKKVESLCIKDCIDIRESLKDYGIEDVGPIAHNNTWIVNDRDMDRTGDSPTAIKDQVMSEVKARLVKDWQTNFLVLYVFAGHGMLAYGKQVLLLNEYNEETGYYKWWGIEGEVRNVGERFPNSY